MTIRLGPLTFFYWFLALVMTGALVFLGIASWEKLQIPFLLFFAVPAMLSLAGTRLGLTRESVFQANTAAAVAVSLIVLFLNVLLIKQLFGYSAMGELAGEHVLVAVLFAIYEETLFLAVATLMIGMGAPAIYAIMTADLVFVGLHALRYPATLFYDMFLLIGRTVMTTALIVTRNSDVPYTTHVLYNLIVALGGS